jgi:hypothetical protein
MTSLNSTTLATSGVAEKHPGAMIKVRRGRLLAVAVPLGVVQILEGVPAG